MGTKESTLNHNIDCTQDDDCRKNRMEKKLLLLGSKKSGKTKLFNKIKYSNGHRFNEKQKLKFKSCIIKYVITSIQKILRCIEQNNNNNQLMSNDIIKECSEIIQSVYLNDYYENENTDDCNDWNSILNYIDILWQHKSFKNEILQFKSLYFVDNSMEYFLNNIQRINEYIYIPSNNDIINLPQIHISKHNSYISNTKVTVKGSVINIFDINNASDYSKWIHCFDDITMLVFVVSLTSYYDTIYNSNYNDEMYTIKLKQKIAIESMEFLIAIIGIDILELILSFVPDEPQIPKNGMIESIHLFTETINNKYFCNTYIVLLLNNMDLFQHKMMRDNDNHVRSFMICFPQYNGNVDSFQQCSNYISQLFISQNQNYNQRQIYTHLISDNDNIDHVINLLFSDIQDCVNQMSLSAGGLL